MRVSFPWLRRLASARLLRVALSLSLLLGASVVSQPLAPVAHAATTPAFPDFSGSSIPVSVRPSSPTVVAEDAFSQTTANPDGSSSATLGLRPLHWWDGQQWRAFDDSLTTVANTPGAAYQSQGNGYLLRFAGSGDVGTGAPVLQLTLGGVTLGLSVAHAAPQALQVSGSQVSYLGVYPGVDLGYTVDHERIKEDVRVNDASSLLALSQLTFPLTLSGGTASQQADGSVVIADSSGQPQLLLLEPFFVDAHGARSAVPITLTSPSTTSGQLRLTLSPDQAWLASTDRAYPLVLDPTIVTGSATLTHSQLASQEVSIFQATDSNSCQPSCSNTLTVGIDGSGQRSDTLFKFLGLNVVPQSAVLTSALLRLDATSTPTAPGIAVHNVTADWTDDVTWSTAPPTDPAAGATSVPVLGWTSFDISGLAHSWLSAGASSGRLRLEDTGGNSTTALFASSSNTNSSIHPQLVLNWVPVNRNGLSSRWTYQSHDYGAGTTSQVNLTTGNLVLQHQDSSIQSLGFSVDLTHTYNSQDPFAQSDHQGADYGEGWSFSQSWRLYEVDNGHGVILRDGSGQQFNVYAQDQDSGTTRSYLRPLWYDYTLTKDLAVPPADPNKVFTLTSDVGGVVRSFDAAGKLTQVVDRNGNFLNYGYDAQDRLTSITDRGGRVTTLVYGDLSGRLSQITDMAGRVSSYAYDANGNLTGISQGVGTPDEVTTHFGYDGYGTLTAVTDPRGHTSSISYPLLSDWETAGQTDGWPNSKAVPVAQSTAFAHYGTGSLQVTFSRTSASSPQSISSPSFNGGMPEDVGLWILAPSGAPQLKAQLTISSSLSSQVAQSAVVSLTAGVWAYVHVPAAPVDPSGGSHSGQVSVWPTSGTYQGSVYLDEWGLRGLVGSQSDAEPTAVTIASYSYTFGSEQAQVSTPDASGVLHLVTTVDYTSTLGLPTSIGGPNNNTYSYDSLNRRIEEVQTESGVYQLLTYYPDSKYLQTQANGFDTNKDQPAEVEHFGYDLATGDLLYHLTPDDEQLRSTNQPYVTTVYLRDSHGNLLSQQTNRYAAGADLDQNLLATPLATLTSVSFTYDSYGRKTSMTDGDGNTTNYSYQAGTPYLTLVDAPAGNGEANRRETTVTPNADGNPAQTIDALGQITTYAYDGLGRLTTINYGVVNGVPAFSTTATYDADSNATAMTDVSGSSTWTYNENNFLTGESRTQNGLTEVASYGRSALGWLTSETTFSNQTVNYGYDGFGRLTSVTDPNDGSQTTSFSYDSSSRLSTVSYAGGRNTESFGYQVPRLQTITVRHVNTILQQFTYAYGIDDQGQEGTGYHNGQLYTVTELDGSLVTYGYDDLDRLTSAVRTGTNPFNQSYQYDANNNRTQSTNNGVPTNATYDAANQLISLGGVSYGYDADGNLTSYGGNTLSYDAANHWVSGTVNGHSVSFSYDGQGRRVAQTIDGARTDEWYGTTGLTLETGVQDAIYLRSPNGKPLSISSGGSHDYYAWDRLWSVTGLLASDGTLAASYTYDPFGLTLGTLPSMYNPVGYAGNYADTATNLILMGARYYQPNGGRFTQLDPSHKKLFTGNRYVYASCNAVNRVDRTGLDDDSVGDGGGGDLDVYDGSPFDVQDPWQGFYDDVVQCVENLGPEFVGAVTGAAVGAAIAGGELGAAALIGAGAGSVVAMCVSILLGGG